MKIKMQSIFLGLVMTTTFLLLTASTLSVAENESKCTVVVKMITNNDIGPLWTMIDGEQAGSMSWERALRTNKYARVHSDEPNSYSFTLLYMKPGTYSVTIKKPDHYVAGEGKREGEVLLTFDMEIKPDYEILEINFDEFDVGSRRDKVYRKE